jgi:hypothetical protein
VIYRLAVIPLLFFACASVPPAFDARIESTERRVVITDRRGERWDISHAVEHYGLSRYGFEFGIGRNAIPPLNNPAMSEKGDGDYPAAAALHEIIGFSGAGEARGYPIQPLKGHEVVNESIGDIQAAVAY